MRPSRGGDAVYRFGKAGLVTAGGILFDDALLDGFVNETESCRYELLSIVLLAGGDRDLQLLQLSLEFVTIRLVLCPLLQALPIPLKRGWMICHLLSSKNRNHNNRLTCESTRASLAAVDRRRPGRHVIIPEGSQAED